MHTPITGIAGLGPDDPKDMSRLMGMIVALSGEVYVLKAELERVKLALRDAGLVDHSALERAGETREMQQILRAEEVTFAATLFRPFAHPDEAPDVSRFMEEQ